MHAQRHELADIKFVGVNSYAVESGNVADLTHLYGITRLEARLPLQH